MPKSGILEVGTNGKGIVVLNHPKIDVDKDGVGHIIFSPNEAMHLATVLAQKAIDAVYEVVCGQGE